MLSREKELALKLNPSRRIYILDASAIMNDPRFWEYSFNYKKKIKRPCTYVITTLFLKEIDNKKNKDKEKHKVFMDRIRQEYGPRKRKLSDGIKLGQYRGGTKVGECDDEEMIFYKGNLAKIPLSEKTKKAIDFLDDDYSDKYLIGFAMELKAMEYRVTILSADVLIKILCRENNIGYCFIGNIIDIKDAIAKSETNPKLKDTNYSINSDDKVYSETIQT
jgi:hypothetical protein